MKKLILTLLSILIVLFALLAISAPQVGQGNVAWSVVAWLTITILPYYVGFLLLLAAIWIIAYVLKHV